MKKRFVTHLIMVVDKSTSMTSIARKTSKAINEFIAKQQDEEGECIVTFVHCSSCPKVEYVGRPLSDWKDYNMRVSGSTALDDSIANAILEADRLRKEQRRRHVKTADMNIVVIATDGQENNSRDYCRNGKGVWKRWTGKGDVLKMIREKKNRKQEDWKFVFLGAGIDAETEAAKYDIEEETAVSVNRFKNDKAIDLLGDKVKGARRSLRTSGTTKGISLTYSAQEKAILR